MGRVDRKSIKTARGRLCHIVPRSGEDIHVVEVVVCGEHRLLLRARDVRSVRGGVEDSSGRESDADDIAGLRVVLSCLAVVVRLAVLLRLTILLCLTVLLLRETVGGSELRGSEVGGVDVKVQLRLRAVEGIDCRAGIVRDADMAAGEILASGWESRIFGFAHPVICQDGDADGPRRGRDGSMSGVLEMDGTLQRRRLCLGWLDFYRAAKVEEARIVHRLRLSNVRLRGLHGGRGVGVGDEEPSPRRLSRLTILGFSEAPVDCQDGLFLLTIVVANDDLRDSDEILQALFDAAAHELEHLRTGELVFVLLERLRFEGFGLLQFTAQTMQECGPELAAKWDLVFDEPLAVQILH